MLSWLCSFLLPGGGSVLTNEAARDSMSATKSPKFISLTLKPRQLGSHFRVRILSCCRIGASPQGNNNNPKHLFHCRSGVYNDNQVRADCPDKPTLLGLWDKRSRLNSTKFHKL